MKDNGFTGSVGIELHGKEPILIGIFCNKENEAQGERHTPSHYTLTFSVYLNPNQVQFTVDVYSYPPTTKYLLKSLYNSMLDTAERFLF